MAFFFILSGYVISYRFFQKKKSENIFSEKSILKISCQRYFRFLIPVSASIFISYLLMKSGLLFNVEAANITGSAWLKRFNTFAPSLNSMFNEAVFGTILNGKCSYNETLWTIRWEFYGTFYILITIIFLKENNNLYQRFLYYAINCILFWDTYYLSFLLGTILCDIMVMNEVSIKRVITKWKPVLILFGLFGIYIASYPNHMKIMEQSSLWSPLLSILSQHKPFFWHTIGAFLLLFIIFNTSFLQRALSWKPLLFLGKISFSTYLCHFFLQNSFESKLFLVFFHRGMNQSLAAIVAFLLYLPFTILIAWIFYYMIEKQGIKFSRWFYSKYITLKKNTI